MLMVRQGDLRVGLGLYPRGGLPLHERRCRRQYGVEGMQEEKNENRFGLLALNWPSLR
jgi:hypothetical protein